MKPATRAARMQRRLTDRLAAVMDATRACVADDMDDRADRTLVKAAQELAESLAVAVEHREAGRLRQ